MDGAMASLPLQNGAHLRAWSSDAANIPSIRLSPSRRNVRVQAPAGPRPQQRCRLSPSKSGFVYCIARQVHRNVRVEAAASQLHHSPRRHGHRQDAAPHRRVSRCRAGVSFATAKRMRAVRKTKEPLDAEAIEAQQEALLEHFAGAVSEEAEVVRYLIRLGVHSSDLPKCIHNAPKDLQEMRRWVEFFKGLGMSTEDVVTMVGKSGKVLSFSVDEKLAPTVDYLFSLGVRPKDIGKTLTRFVNLLSISLEGKLKPTADYLTSLGVQKGYNGMGKLVTRVGSLLSCSVDGCLEPTVNYLLEIGVKYEDMGYVITRFPHLLSYSVDRKLRPAVEYLLKLGVRPEAMGRVMTLHPPLFGCNMEEKVGTTVDYLLNDLGVNQEDLGKMIARFPALLTYSLGDKLKPTVEWFLANGYSKQDVAKIASNYPNTLGFSLTKALIPKHEYLTLVMGKTPGDVMKFPAYYTYSLRKRIKPRWEAIYSKNLHGQLGSLGQLLTPTPQKFDSVVSDNFERESGKMRVEGNEVLRKRRGRPPNRLRESRQDKDGEDAVEEEVVLLDEGTGVQR